MLRSVGSGQWAGLGLRGWPITLFPSQAKNYMEGLPELEKKDFASVLTNASPQGRAGWVKVSGNWVSMPSFVAGPDLLSPQP